jgi:4-diphosphocytidyl-2-C-methyl-D-erythritol kinase
MLFFPNAKINLGLNVLRRREDGYHDLETAFYPVPLKDVLEIVRTGAEVTGFTAYGNPIPGDPAANLCLKAWELLRNEFPTLPPIHIHLYKNIPIGAGLGGGSSDGAWTLIALNRQFRLGLTRQQLLEYAARLGSDCPFFLLNEPCLGTGRGHQLQPISVDLTGFSIALVDPGIHISTATAFSLCTPGEHKTPISTILSRPVPEWRKDLINDFEEPVFHLHPELREIKKILYDTGAVYASLTGSGSSFFGIFAKHRGPNASPFPDRYKYRILP